MGADRIDLYTTMFNFHKLATYYGTLVMLGIGGTFVRTPNVLLDAFGVLPLTEDKTTIPLEGVDPVYQLAYHLGFGSHLVVGLLGLYALWHNTLTHRRSFLLAFGTHQALFAWAASKTMPTKWQVAYLLPVQANMALSVLLMVTSESEPEVPSLKRRRPRVVKKQD